MKNTLILGTGNNSVGTTGKGKTPLTDRMKDFESRMTECLSRLPEGVTVEYEIINGSKVNWRITEKPVDLTPEQERKILSDLHEVSNSISGNNLLDEN